MIALLWLCLISVPIVVGLGIQAVVYRKNVDDNLSVSEGYVLGCIACIAMAEAAHVIGMLEELSLETVGTLLGGLVLFVTVAALAAVILLGRKVLKKQILPPKGSLEKTVFPFVFLGLLLFQLLYIYCVQPILTPGDITLETVQSFLAEDGIYRVMPLTGQISATGMPGRYKILGLPTLYAVLCKAFGIEAEVLVCHAVPVVVLGIAYMGYYYLSGVLFGKEAFKKRHLFLAIMALLLLFSDSGVFTNGYSALHSGYLGTTVRNLILVPYAFAVSLKKQWWKAILCALTEVCIVWTFWGLGVCVVILAGMLLITIADEKSVKIHKLLQIFRNKEDLT